MDSCIVSRPRPSLYNKLIIRPMQDLRSFPAGLGEHGETRTACNLYLRCCTEIENVLLVWKRALGRVAWDIHDIQSSNAQHYSRMREGQYSWLLKLMQAWRMPACRWFRLALMLGRTNSKDGLQCVTWTLWRPAEHGLPGHDLAESAMS